MQGYQDFFIIIHLLGHIIDPKLHYNPVFVGRK